MAAGGRCCVDLHALICRTVLAVDSAVFASVVQQRLCLLCCALLLLPLLLIVLAAAKTNGNVRMVAAGGSVWRALTCAGRAGVHTLVDVDVYTIAPSASECVHECGHPVLH